MRLLSTSAFASVLPAATDTRHRFLERRAQREREKYAASRGDEYTPRVNSGGPTSKSKERRAQHERDKYADARGDAYKPRVNVPVGRAQAKGSVHSQTEKSRRILVACAIRIRVS